MKYNHKASTIEEATGVNAEEIAVKAAELGKGRALDSKYIELIEEHFTKRELAVMAFLFVHEMDERPSSLDIPEDVPDNVKMIKIDKDNLPPGMLEFFEEIIDEKMIEDNKDEDTINGAIGGEGGLA
jgi:hypothetical protein